jgi:hypothetical protein
MAESDKRPATFTLTATRTPRLPVRDQSPKAGMLVVHPSGIPAFLTSHVIAGALLVTETPSAGQPQPCGGAVGSVKHGRFLDGISNSASRSVALDLN